MNLELRKVAIRDIQFSQENKIIDGCLHVNPDTLEELVLEDARVKSVSFDIARPGESTRIVPVKDVIEPRAKVDGETFPGLFREDMQEAGEGTTYCLEGMAVTSTGPIVGFQEGVIDMMGPGTEYTIYSQLCHLCMSSKNKDYVDQHDHEVVVRLAGIKVAKYLADFGLCI